MDDINIKRKKTEALSAADKLCKAQCLLTFGPALLFFLIPPPLVEFWMDFSRSSAESIYLVILFILPYAVLAVFYIVLLLARRAVLRASGLVYRPPVCFYLCHIAGGLLFLALVRYLPMSVVYR